MRGKQGGRGSGKNRVSNVRIVDPEDGTDGVRIDRMISQLQNSHSQVRVLCNTGRVIQLANADQYFNFDTAFIRGSDEFNSLAAQFETYRIRAIKVDIYDVSPSVVATNGASTFHDVYTINPAFVFESIVDGPDFKVIPPGTGKITMHWMAKGTEELGFQATAPGTGITPSNYGGIRLYTGAGTVGANKYQIVVKGVVDFRGRI